MRHEPISSSDPNAVQLLQEKIDRAEALQARMKAANAVVKKHKNDRRPAIPLLMAQGFTETQANQLFEPDFGGRIGFADYELTNNNANIRRMKQRIVEIQGETKTREMAPTETIETPAGISIVENSDNDRLQIFFPGKPAGFIRAMLKSNGFHWSPTEGAWQRQLNENARWAAKRIMDNIKPVDMAVKTEVTL